MKVVLVLAFDGFRHVGLVHAWETQPAVASPECDGNGVGAVAGCLPALPASESLLLQLGSGAPPQAAPTPESLLEENTKWWPWGEEDKCDATAMFGVIRQSAWRRHENKCKCKEKDHVLACEDDACPQIGRYFSEEGLGGRRCWCVVDQCHKVEDWSSEFTTVKGCTCRSDSPCGAHLGTMFKCDTCKTRDGCGHWGLPSTYDYCDYRPDTVRSFIKKSFSNKMDYFWGKITANSTRYPHFPLLSNFLTSVRTTFDNYRPEMPPSREKLIHTVGSICKFHLDISPSSPYTGLLGPGLKVGFVRMGSAVDPGSYGDGVAPGLGFKLPRSGRHDGDFVMLNALGFGEHWDFFHLNQSNHIAPANGFTAVVAEKFKEASQCPYQVGLSDLATYSQDGRESSPPKFPFKLLMVSGPSVKTGTKGKTLDAIHAELDAIPLGTTLYNVYACSKSSGDEMAPAENLDACGGAMLLGALKTASKCTTSWYGDSAFHVRHQRIEEDWQLEPSYRKMGAYDADQACGASVTSRAPPSCGLDSMLNSDA